MPPHKAGHFPNFVRNEIFDIENLSGYTSRSHYSKNYDDYRIFLKVLDPKIIEV